MTISFDPKAPPPTMGEAIQGLKSMSVEEAMFAVNIVVIIVKDAKVKAEMDKLGQQNQKLKALNDALAALGKLQKELGSASSGTVEAKLKANPGLEEEINRALKDAGVTGTFPGAGYLVRPLTTEQVKQATLDWLIMEVQMDDKLKLGAGFAAGMTWQKNEFSSTRYYDVIKSFVKKDDFNAVLGKTYTTSQRQDMSRSQEGRAMLHFYDSFQAKFREIQSESSRNVQTLPGGVSWTTKVSDLAKGIKSLEGEASLRGQSQQMTMIDLQSFIQELNGATDMASSILRKLTDLAAGTLQKTS